MVELKSKQKEIYNYLIAYSDSKGYPPSIREICTAVGLRSTGTVHDHLKKLEKKGLLRRDSTKPRALEIIDMNNNKMNSNKKEMLNIPIVKNVLNDDTLLSVNNIEDTFPLPIDYIKHEKSLFMFRVFNSNMINAGLLPGDLAIFEEHNTALRNDIILTKVDNKTIIARYIPEKYYIYLKTDDDNMTPLVVDECIILGKLAGLFRGYN